MPLRILAIMAVMLACGSSQPTTTSSEFQASTAAAPAPMVNGVEQITEESCQKLFDQLKKAKGILPSQKPHLKMVRSLSNRSLAMALTDNAKGIVEVEKRLISMCNEKLGDQNFNGLAFILSHELAHFFKEHNVVHPVIKEFADQNAGRDETITVLNRNNQLNETELEELQRKYNEISKKYSVRKNESEADLEAGFLSYLAGYETIKAGPQFLSEAYSFYQLDTNGGKYPSLRERQEIVTKVGNELDTLIHIFESGNLFTLTNQTKHAVNCYERVLDDFENPDLYNNLGVVKLKEVANNFSFNEVGFFLPITLNLSPIDRDAGMAIDENTDLDSLFRAQYLGDIMPYLEVVPYFEKAIEMNPDAYAGHLNKSILHLLQYHVKKNHQNYAPFYKDELTFSRSAALKARSSVTAYDSLNKKALADITTMLGVLECTEGRRDSGIALFRSAQQIQPGNVISNLNIRIFNGANFFDVDPDRPPGGGGFNACNLEEKVNGTETVVDFIQSDAIDWFMQTDIKPIMKRFVTDTMRLNVGRTNDFNIYNVSIVRGSKISERYTYLWSKDSYSGKTACGELTHGSTLGAMEENYGTEGLMMQSQKSTLFSFMRRDFVSENDTKGGIVFNYDPQAKLQSVIIYDYFK